MTAIINLTRDLVSRESVTPNDAGCQQVIQNHLEKLDFVTEPLPFGDVKNLWARRGSEAPLFVFAGHTDVVPTGPLDQWTSSPFKPDARNGLLYGRGSADMKGSLAAMMRACSMFIEKYPQHTGSIGFLITSDEEGPAVDGTIRVVETLEARNEKIDWCLVGEPSSTEKIGDVVKNGRRGSLSGSLTIHGLQGHIAYPHLAENPIHTFAPVLNELVSHQWDQGNEHFPPTSFQVSNIKAGTGASNVIPGDLHLDFNLRFSTELSEDVIRDTISELLDSHRINYSLEWTLSGLPFLTSEGKLVDATKAAISTICGYETELSTAGGTSDGRFIAPTGSQVIELGPVNESIHKIDEHVRMEDLETLALIYVKILEELLPDSAAS